MSREPAHPRHARTEAEFQAWVVHHARQLAWKPFHVVRPVGDLDADFPDLLLARDGRLVVWELKMPGNVATPGQLEWLRVLGLIPNVEVGVKYPADADEMLRELARRAPRAKGWQRGGFAIAGGGDLSAAPPDHPRWSGPLPRRRAARAASRRRSHPLAHP